MITITVGGVDITSKVSKSSFAINTVARDEVDSCAFSMTLKSSEYNTYAPEINEIIEIDKDGTLIFGGLISAVSQSRKSSDLVQASIQSHDYSYLFTQRRVADSFISKDVNYIINTLMNDYANYKKKVIDTFEAGWSAGSFQDNYYVQGNGAWEINGTMNKTINQNLSILGNGELITDDNKFSLWVYLPEGETITSIELKLGDTGLTNYYTNTLTTFNEGWNYILFDRLDFTTSGTPSWSNILDIEIIVNASDDIIIDDFRILTERPVTINNIQGGDYVIDYVGWNYEPLDRVLKDFSELIGYYWYVDYNKDLHFYPIGTETAPFEVTETNGNKTYRSMSFMSNSSQIKNSVFIQGGEFIGSALFEEKFEGDGERTTFTIGNKYSDLSVYVDRGSGFVQESVGIDFLNDDDGTHKWFANFNEKYIKQSALETVLSDTDVVKMTYYPYLPLITRVSDLVSVEEYGLNEFVIIDRNIEDKAGARTRGLAEVRAYSNPMIDGSFTTLTAGLVAGQQIRIVDNDIDDFFVVRSINTTFWDNDNFRYKCNFISKRKLTLVESLIRLFLKETKTVKLNENAILDKLLSHPEDIGIEDNHNEILDNQPVKVYGIHEDQGRYNLCQYG